jgi:hypothetical protein
VTSTFTPKLATRRFAILARRGIADSRNVAELPVEWGCGASDIAVLPCAICTPGRAYAPTRQSLPLRRISSIDPGSCLFQRQSGSRSSSTAFAVPVAPTPEGGSIPRRSIPSHKAVYARTCSDRSA